MESSSIVSFNNESTLQATLKPESNNVSVHELALHAMRDRCLLLQKRINTLEADNMKLKLDKTKNTECIPNTHVEDDERYKLHQKIAELTKQKSQLMHHVFMVSCENRNLWNKISNINKSEGPPKLESSKQPLVRTNTFIQSSTPKTSSNYQEKYSESSLEEISLKLINSYIQEKSQLVEQYEQMAQLQEVTEDILNVDSIGFTYMEDPTSDSLKEIRTHTEKLHNMKKELAQQEKDLKLVISRVQHIMKEGFKCPTCISRNNKSVSSEHKESETSDSLVNFVTPVNSTQPFNENLSEVNNSIYKNEETVITVDSRDRSSEEHVDRICPICGQIFPKDTIFNEFLTHVENHFTGDMESDSIVDNLDNSKSIENVIL